MATPTGGERETREQVWATIPSAHPLDEHNRRWLEQLHPPDWKNPEPEGRYNLLVIGAGPAGLVAAAGAAGLGAKVALVEKHLMGGDCQNVGCVPSKALLRAAKGVADFRAAGQFGVKNVPEPVVDFGAAMERLRRIRAELSHHDSAERFSELGVDVFIGEGEFTDADTFEIDGKAIRFAKACVATGARAADLPIEGLAEAGALTNETVFSLTERPERLGIIGAGPIGCEMAQAFARLGTRVTLLEASNQILGKEDRDAAEVLEAALQRDGVEIRTNIDIRRLRQENGEKVVEAGASEGSERCAELRFDQILVGVGRAPNVEGLGLEAAGVKFDQKGIEVDERLRTTNPNIFSAGDVCFPYKFTHAADAMARIVIRNALFFGRSKTRDLVIPWCTYTDPEIAHVGMYENDARKEGIDVKTLKVSIGETDRGIIDGDEEGFVKIHTKAGSDGILGATIVARHAGDMIAQLSQAMVDGTGLGTIAETMFPYPTQAEAIKKAADAYNRTRLSPGVKKLFERFLRWRR